MTSTFQSCFAACLLGLALATPAGAATAPYASAEEARKALEILKSDAPPGDKAVACKRLAVFGGPEAVPALAPLLSDPKLAAWARIPLEAIPGAAVDEAFREALRRLQGNLLVGVINSVGIRGDAKAVDTLAIHLKDADAEVASAAAVALGRIGGSPALGALEAALPAAKGNVRSAVAEGLILSAERALAADQSAEAIRLYDQLRAAELPKQRIREATRGAILARQSQGLPLLLETLRSTDEAMFGIGLRTARELPGRAVTEALAAELNRAPAERQSPLLLALTDRHDDAVWPAVFGATAKGSKNLRLVAIGALERLGNATAVPVLLDAATDSEAEIAKAAKLALAHLAGQGVDATLGERLGQATGAKRRVLVELAGQRHLVGVNASLFAAAADSDADVRAAAVKSLGDTVTQPEVAKLADLLGKTSSEDEIADLEAALDAACTRLTDKAACAAPLLARFEKSSAPAKAAILRVLGTTGTAEALGTVKASLGNSDKTVRDAAFRVLADWSDPAALPALLDIVRKPADDLQRTLALRGTVRLLGTGNQPSGPVVTTYSELLGLVRRVDDRKLVLSGIGAVPHADALKLVEPLLGDAEVRKEAESAALGIAGSILGTAPAEAKAMATRLQSSPDAAIRDRAAQVLKKLQ